MERDDNEVFILAKQYSALRRRQNKWKYRGNPADPCLIKVNQDLFSTSDLAQRKMIKRTQRVFIEIYKFWQIINPFSIPGLSRAVYSKILRFLYKTLFKMHLSDFVFEEYLNNDIELDFKGEFCLFFCDFYDAIFDIIDQVTIGKSVPEYISAIRNLVIQLKYSETLDVINLNNKTHCVGKKPKYVLWMKEFLKVKTEESNDFRSLPRIKSTKNYLDRTSPLGANRKSVGVMKSFLLEEIIEGRNKFLTAFQEEKRKTMVKDLLKKVTGKPFV